MNYRKASTREFVPTGVVKRVVMPVHSPNITVGLYSSHKGFESVGLKLGDLFVLLTAVEACTISDALVDAAESITKPAQPNPRELKKEDNHEYHCTEA